MQPCGYCQGYKIHSKNGKGTYWSTLYRVLSCECVTVFGCLPVSVDWSIVLHATTKTSCFSMSTTMSKTSKQCLSHTLLPVPCAWTVLVQNKQFPQSSVDDVDTALHIRTSYSVSGVSWVMLYSVDDTYSTNIQCIHIIINMILLVTGVPLQSWSISVCFAVCTGRHRVERERYRATMSRICVEHLYWWWSWSSSHHQLFDKHQHTAAVVEKDLITYMYV